MAINNKKLIKSFSLIEVLVSMLLLSILLVVSIKSYYYLAQNTNQNELRYLALNKIDSEMNRLIFAYENLSEGSFTDNSNIDNQWDIHFNVPVEGSNDVNIYEKNPLEDMFGLGISTRLLEKRNVVEIKNVINGTINSIDENDIVGIMAWKISNNGNDANISLSITYPYLIRSISNSNFFGNRIKIKHMNGSSISFLDTDYSLKETINIKTSTKVK